MSKIVCDVCGSTYSETEVQCPVCGTAKSEAAKPAVETTGEANPNNAGVFSKNNNRKTGVGAITKKSGEEKSVKSREEGAPSNMAMIIIVGVLLMAIIAVCIFIAVRIFDNPDPTEPTGSTQGTVDTQPTNPDIPCTGIELVGNATKTLTFAAWTERAQLNVKAIPENTTDTVVYTFVSSDPSVVLVDQSGVVTPVSNGVAVITISYGTYTISVNVTCDIPAPITELKLAKTDITLSPTNGLSANLYNGELDPVLITWTSSDENVAYVENGVVTAVGNGKATITATYGDLTATCKVIVNNMNVETGYVLSCTWGVKSDATLVVGESLEISLINKETGEHVTGLQWTGSNDFPKCCTAEDSQKGVKITANETTANVSGQFVYIQTEYEGTVYKFIIRVKAATTQE